VFLLCEYWYCVLRQHWPTGSRRHAELSSRRVSDHLSNDVPFVDEDRRRNIVRIQAHAGLGDVNVHIAK
jgi:hypothetical protein